MEKLCDYRAETKNSFVDWNRKQMKIILSFQNLSFKYVYRFFQRKANELITGHKNSWTSWNFHNIHVNNIIFSINWFGDEGKKGILSNFVDSLLNLLVSHNYIFPHSMGKPKYTCCTVIANIQTIITWAGSMNYMIRSTSK